MAHLQFGWGYSLFHTRWPAACTNVIRKSYLTCDPWQASCGHHLCGSCYEHYSNAKEIRTVVCSECKLPFDLAECFRDKAVERELNNTIVPCIHKGCLWRGEGRYAKDHMNSCSFASRNESSYPFTSSNKSSDPLIQSLNAQLLSTQERISSMSRDLETLKLEVPNKLQPLVDSVSKISSSVQSLQANFEEMSLLIQTLQAASYSGVYIWKIPDIRRRRQDARTGKITSLYSAPFYTSRHGYKMCLRVYLNGDGSGKETHLSFFLTLMKGEYDALLQWPFSLPVTLTLLDQDKRRHVIQSFHPEPSSCSFQRPKEEMNVASGCPRFAPLNVLDNSAYVRDDTMFLKCIIDTSALEAMDMLS
ncbi:hypothetical protein EMCRGX_G013223 [Ephydatia muelleri]